MQRPTPPRLRVRRRWIILGAIVFALFVSGSAIVRFYTDLLWFGELDITAVFWRVILTRVGVGVVGGLGALLVVLINLEVARRMAPRYRFATAGTDIAEQYRSVFRPYARIANFGIAGVVGLFTGLSTSATWERFLLWRNAQPFGVKAPAPFGGDVSFYVFGIPFQRSVLSWLFGILVVSLLLTAVAHLLNGSVAIQPEQNRIQVADMVKVHVSVLLGLVALLKAWAYRLDQFELVYSPRGTVTGASYTDVHAQLPALRLLMFIAVIAAVIFFVNVFRSRGWLLPVVAIGLWGFSSVLLGALIPAAVQRFQVTPNEPEREAPYIERNIEATRAALALDDIQVSEFQAEASLSAETLEENQGTIDNVRLWDPDVLQPTFQRLQAIRTYYDFHDVDIDRYTLDGQLTQVMLSAREVDPSKLAPSAQNWINNRLIYTHGYGSVDVPAKSVTPQGLPEFLVKDLPPDGPDVLLPEQPGLYYGEHLPSYSVVNTNQEEIDYSIGEQEVITTHYEGTGGIEVSNWFQKLAFALRFSDTDMLISDQVSPRSRVMMRRNIVERAATAAPFLRFDRDPYLVATDERFFWILDAYTVSDRYPYAEQVNLGSTLAGQPIRGGNVNYMRNSVKVVVDAYDGETTFYVMDDDDALIATYRSAFPELFTDGDQMPEALVPHLRYPEDLFQVQANQFRTYHILEPQRLYEREDVWDIPNDPVHSSAERRIAMEPYYVVMKLPGEEKEEFLLMLPFTPKDRPILNGWMAARMDPGHYGEVIALSLPRGVSIDGPENIAARIEQNDAISRQFTLWEGAGSRVERGNLLVIPIGQSMIYIQPIYLVAEESDRALPELRRVIVVIGDRIGFEPTLEASLRAALSGEAPDVDDDGDPTPAPDPTGNVAELLQQAIDHFARAEAALRSGDLATYQRENEAGRRAVEEAQNQSGG